MMGCGNNKVSRGYLTSQPITTPSARATRAGVADLRAQILRLAAQEMKDGVQPAAKARTTRADDAEKAATKASDAAGTKAPGREQEAEEVEDAKRLLINTAFRVALEQVRLPGQPEKIVQNIRGKDVSSPSDGAPEMNL